MAPETYKQVRTSSATFLAVVTFAFLALAPLLELPCAVVLITIAWDIVGELRVSERENASEAYARDVPEQP